MGQLLGQRSLYLSALMVYAVLLGAGSSEQLTVEHATMLLNPLIQLQLVALSVIVLLCSFRAWQLKGGVVRLLTCVLFLGAVAFDAHRFYAP